MCRYGILLDYVVTTTILLALQFSFIIFLIVIFDSMNFPLKDFAEEAQRVARIIIKEQFLPPERRAIPARTSTFGGVAGKIFAFFFYHRVFELVKYLCIFDYIRRRKVSAQFHIL